MPLPVAGALNENDVEFAEALVPLVLAVPNENADLDVVLPVASGGLPKTGIGVEEAEPSKKEVGEFDFSLL